MKKHTVADIDRVVHKPLQLSKITNLCGCAYMKPSVPDLKCRQIEACGTALSL